MSADAEQSDDPFHTFDEWNSDADRRAFEHLALECIRSFRKTPPPDWSFDREDANARGHGLPD
jgi:hypothetical protein